MEPALKRPSGVDRCALGHLILAVAVCVAMLGAPAAGAAPGEGYVKYYTVAATQNGAPENLTEIAVRFLGSGERSGDIYSLNVGRRQPDGASLTDPAKLHAGWVLVMPWDATGTDIRYGVLPAGAPAPKPRASGPATGAGTPLPTQSPAADLTASPPADGSTAGTVGEGQLPAAPGDPGLSPGATGSPALTADPASPASPPSMPAASRAASSGGGGPVVWLFAAVLLFAGGFLILRHILRRGPEPEEDWSDPEPPRVPPPPPPMSTVPIPGPYAPAPPAPMPTVPVPAPRARRRVPTPSASALRAAESLAGGESHWTDHYRESEQIDGDDDRFEPDEIDDADESAETPGENERPSA